MTNYQPIIQKELATLAKHEKAEGNVFKARAYNKVIQAIQDKPIYNLEDLKGVPGIGDKIRAKIEEIIKTGQLHQAEDIRKQEAENPNPMVELQKVYGIGPKKAQSLIAKGIRSIQDLRTYVQSHPDELHDKQKVGLAHVQDLQLRIPRDEMDQHNTKLLTTLRTCCPNTSGAIVGSYRRGLPTSGDIDMLICGEDPALLHQILQTLTTQGYITAALAEGPKKFMGICRLTPTHPARRLDILLTPPREYPFALLYFTGPDRFNIKMRKHALTKGYSLNEHGFTPEAPPTTPLKTEEDIFQFLNFPYKTPVQRENTHE